MTLSIVGFLIVKRNVHIVQNPIIYKVGLLFAHVLFQEVHIPRLITPPEKGQDLEQRVIDAYIIQCQAEAQEGRAP